MFPFITLEKDVNKYIREKIGKNPPFTKYIKLRKN